MFGTLASNALKRSFRTTARRLYHASKEETARNRSCGLITLLASAATATVYYQCHENNSTRLESELDDGTTMLLNWSGTHAVHAKNYWEPESLQEVEALVKRCHQRGQAIRPLGSALSPNGIAFQPDGMVSMANLDHVLEVKETADSAPTVTVQAGARVSQVIEALRPYGLTLPNLASIAEQQMGGFVQVGAHGTGRCIAPVDHYVTNIKLVTPAQGLVELSRDDEDPQKRTLFELAKVGLGCLGVVVEVTMECIPAHNLVEHTFVLTRKEAREKLDSLLKEHKHMRYMWIPYADAVVVVTNDPEGTVDTEKAVSSMTPEERIQPMTDLLIELTKDNPEPVTADSIKGMGFGEIRDALLAVDPLGFDHVKRCNEAEAEFWRRSEGYQVKPSDQLLQFDCGGQVRAMLTNCPLETFHVHVDYTHPLLRKQQWVWEVCFPTGTQEENNGNDMHFMESLLHGIEEQSIPAHSPIEQRWTASSSSLMSPAHGEPGGLHSWVGIINYLPSDDERQRREITELFSGQYCDLMRAVGKPVNATSHWAKLERPASMWQLADLQIFLQERYPLKLFNEARSLYDPKNILSNPLLDLVLGDPRNKES